MSIKITLTSEITVRPIDAMGGDHSVVAAARVSTSGEEAIQFPPKIGFAKNHPVGLHNLDLDSIVADYAAGDSLASIARRFGCSPGLIRKALLGKHLDPRERRHRPEVGDGEKYCPACGVVKPFSDFSKASHRQRRRGGLAAECRKCVYARSRAVVLARRELVDRMKLEAGCARCGYREHPAALDFDHLPGSIKCGQVSEMYTCSPSRIEAEISKCQILCSNCHKIITYERRRNENKSDI